MHPTHRGPSRRAVSGLVIAAMALVLLWLTPDVLLIAFGSILVALLLHGGSDWIARHTGLPQALAMTVFCLAILGGFAAMVVVAAPVLAEQMRELWEQIPRALQVLRDLVQRQPWGSFVIDQMPGRLASTGGSLAGRATSAVVSTFGGIGDILIIAVIGVFLAANPRVYIRGLLLLIAPSGWPRAVAVLREVGAALRHWLVAQLLAMTVIGLLTTAGLWLLGVPLAVVLGVIAALFTFIPNLGPILASVPALLLALADSPSLALWVAGLYAVVQAIEGNVTTPLIQQHTIALPPALILGAQLIMGALFGILGLALATPLTAAGMTLVRLLYVDDYLGAEEKTPPA
ncbi:MAG TPA: AI-2E family transporter [Acetobacteraceae bacterium]